MSSDFNTTLSGIKASDTIIELKASTVDGKESTEVSTTDQCAGEANAKIEATEDVPLKEKMKPPPLDVSAAQEFQQQQAMGLEQEPLSSAPPIPGLMLDRRKGKERKIGHRRVNEEGEITFKKIQTSQIMGSIQLGISNAIGSLASKPERDLLIQDFAVVETTAFPGDGSNITPAHRYSDFKFKSYAPVAFRYFRDLFGIQPDDFLLSLCNYPMIELTNPGASGSIFYLTADDEFIIKTVQHKEAEFLQKLLAGYYMNLNQNPRTLLPKFYALYCYQCGGKNVRLVVMNNLLPSGIKLHEKYDLKGSTYKRKASKQERKKNSPTYKDLDFMAHHPDGILLEAETYNALIKTIQRDCRVLNSFQIMDYSLLMGIHNLDVAKREKLEQHRKEEEANMSRVSDDSESASPDQVSGKTDSKLTRSKSLNRQRLAAFSTAMESIQAEVDVPEDDDDVPPGGIPAKNSKGEQLLLFLGIIDILQSFRLKKKLEHTLKSILHDGDTVSVHRPGFYASRFQDFMSKHVFKKIPSTGQHRKFKTMVTSVLALKQSPSKRKNPARKTSSDADTSKSLLSKIPSECENPPEDSSSSNVATIKHGEGDGKDLFKKEKQESHSTVTESRIVSQKFTSVVENTSITVDKSEVVSLSQVNIQTDSPGDCLSETSSPSMSGYGPAARSVMWTPPHSVEGSTPTHTEGTPSFTESSSSVDADSISHPMM